MTWTDGSNRRAYKQQKEVLDWVEERIDSKNVLAITAPTASGKSYICRAIQRNCNTSIVTINNQLVKQFIKDYNTVTPVIGLQHYPNLAYYNAAWENLHDPSTSVILNPISYAMSCYKDYPSREVLILDEADQHLGLLLEFSKFSIKLTAKERLDAEPTLDFVRHILNKRIGNLQKRQLKKFKYSVGKKIDKYRFMLSNIAYDPTVLAASIDEDMLYVRNIGLSASLRNKLFGDRTVIMLSGTLMSTDIGDLIGYSRKVEKYSVPSPIPVEKRQVLYEPYQGELSYPIDYKEWAKYINQLLDKHTERPAIVHLPYSDAERLKKYLDRPDVFWHSKENKARALAKNAVKEGVLIACGMSTGVDLKGNKCRLNIIGKAMYPSLNDEWVKKRRARHNGEQWYVEQAIKHLVQSAGRATRTKMDYSKIVIADPRLMALIASNKNSIPDYFLDSLVLGESVNADRGLQD